MEIEAIITYVEEVNHHVGYCSDAENEYTSTEKTHVVKVPLSMQSLPISDDFWGKMLPEPDVSFDCGCCDVGEGESHGLSIHDFRHTIKRIEFKRYPYVPSHPYENNYC
jgi:hypothetical protein